MDAIYFIALSSTFISSLPATSFSLSSSVPVSILLKSYLWLTSVLAPGVCHLHVPDQDPKVCAIHGGFFEILQDSMTILAEVCEWPDEIDVGRAEDARVRAERRLSDKESGTDIARAILALKRSAARIEAAGK